MNRRVSYQFDGFVVDLKRRTLTSHGADVDLPAKAFELLAIFVSNAGKELDRATLMKSLWPDTSVQEANLTQSVFLLRKALQRSMPDNRLIVTLPGRGYVFTGDVRQSESRTDPQYFSTACLPSPKGPNPRSLVIAPFKIVGEAHKAEWLSAMVAGALISSDYGRTVLSLSPPHSPNLMVKQSGTDLLLTGEVLNQDGAIELKMQIVDSSSGSPIWIHKCRQSISYAAISTAWGSLPSGTPKLICC